MEIAQVTVGLAAVVTAVYALRQRNTAFSLALFFIAAFLSGIVYLDARLLGDAAAALLATGLLVFIFLLAALKHLIFSRWW